MRQVELLESMWAPKVKRATTLLVPGVTVEGLGGSLNNDDWAFKVPYAFREALDIRYEQRVKGNVPYMIWTQGPIISFKEGDTLHRKDGQAAVQVAFAQPMEWKKTEEKMYEGLVTYINYSVLEGVYVAGERVSCTQMKFLALLIGASGDG